MEYFTFVFKIINGVPKIKILLKDKYKKSTSALRESGFPYSGVEFGYYFHHVGDVELAKKIWTVRKSLSNKNFLIDFLFERKVITDEDYLLCNSWKENIRKKFVANHLAVVQSEPAREKMRNSYNRELHSSIHKKLWSENRKRYIEAGHCQEVKERRIKSFKAHLDNSENYEKYLAAMRDTQRKEKISKASKSLWKNADDLKIRRMLQNNKNFVYNNNKMNSFEFKVANILDELNVCWEYEPLIRFGSRFVKPDFIINNKIVVECFGDFWHENPNIYDDNKILYANKTTKEQRNCDKQRIYLLKSQYENVIIIWESFLKELDIKQFLFKELLCK